MAFHINGFDDIASYQTFISAHPELYPQLYLTKNDGKIFSPKNASEDPNAPGPGPTPTAKGSLKFTSSGAQTISFTEVSGTSTSLEISDDGTNWSSWNKTSHSFNGDVYVRGMNPSGFGNTDESFAHFSFGTSASVSVSGNIMHLLDYTQNLTVLPVNFTFTGLFFMATALSDASGLELPAPILTEGCYRTLFYNCTHLVSIPTLPATTLAPLCYTWMFGHCTSLTTPPALPVENLADNCYCLMFAYSGITSAPALPATILADSCYENMFSGCESLTTAPILNAPILVDCCYRKMFSNCTNLASIKCLATNISASNCVADWVKNVAASGTFTKASSMTSWPSGVSGIPENWTTISE